MKKGRSTYTFKTNNNEQVIENIIKQYLKADQYIEEEKDGEKFYKYSDALKGYRGFKYLFNDDMLTIQAWLIGVGGDVPIEDNLLNLGLNMQIQSYKKSLETLLKEINTATGEHETNNESNQTENNVDNETTSESDQTENNVDSETTNDSNNENNNTHTYCTNCGKKIINDSKFCSSCGSPINKSQPSNETVSESNQITSQEKGSQNQSSNNQTINQFENSKNQSQEKMVIVAFILSIVGILLAFSGYIYGIFIYIFNYYAGINGLKTSKNGLAIATIVLTSIGLFISLMLMLGIILY